MFLGRASYTPRPIKFIYINYLRKQPKTFKFGEDTRSTYATRSLPSEFETLSSNFAELGMHFYPVFHPSLSLSLFSAEHVPAITVARSSAT